MEKLIVERIEENKKIFTKEELTFIKSNVNIIQKIYLLAMLDSNT